MADAERWERVNLPNWLPYRLHLAYYRWAMKRSDGAAASHD